MKGEIAAHVFLWPARADSLSNPKEHEATKASLFFSWGWVGGCVLATELRLWLAVNKTHSSDDWLILVQMYAVMEEPGIGQTP